MSLPLRRLFQARQMVPRIARRPVTTESVQTLPEGVGIFPPSTSSTAQDLEPLSTAASPKENPHLTLTEASQSNKKPASEIHWALGQGYELGGLLKQAEGPLDRLENGRPKWGEWGIPIKFTSDSGTFVSNADNCRCEKCMNQDTMQRAIDTFSIPAKILPKEVQTNKEGLKVTWAHDGHVSNYTWDWLLRHRSRTIPAVSKQENLDPLKYWGSSIGLEAPSVPYDEIMAGDKGVGSWTDKIRQYGFCYVDGCPATPEATKKLLERIAFIRVTHYGGFYDFTADLTMKDTAYTNFALPAHTDTAYFTDPAGLQMFHLLSHTEGDGGESLLVDGFKAAKTLLDENASAYDILSRTPVTWHASGNEGITITPAKKMPVLNFQDLKEGQIPRLLQIRWNNLDRGVVALREDYGMGAEKWYKAAAKWNEILNRKEMQYWAQMKPGSPLMFDNWRVLHGRSAFTGKRRVCGGYINHDDYVSRWRNTNFTREEALNQIL
ncbi:trimethyllysine dioxygenase [Marssonina coronariae]|uniref:trimethyllysine dioxygenase n=1 Tax=Diplocarpon coronariae TaxID=2795749 RepID=A0A218Z8W1_9HELO|nr:trimethyllysine dioxygenase [Marssonina coronariae]